MAADCATHHSSERNDEIEQLRFGAQSTGTELTGIPDGAAKPPLAPLRNRLRPRREGAVPWLSKPSASPRRFVGCRITTADEELFCSGEGRLGAGSAGALCTARTPMLGEGLWRGLGVILRLVATMTFPVAD
eukprot:scaffold157811_cov31-Tisochrysis_lutea.AAC.3